jgi:hypothetical protein
VGEKVSAHLLERYDVCDGDPLDLEVSELELASFRQGTGTL